MLEESWKICLEYLLLDGRYTILLSSTSSKNAESYRLATIALHNYLRLTDNAVYTPVGFVDSQALNGEIRPGVWCQIVDDVAGMSSIPNVCGSQYSNNVIALCEAMKDYVSSETGSIEWQWDHVRRT